MAAVEKGMPAAYGRGMDQSDRIRVFAPDAFLWAIADGTLPDDTEVIVSGDVDLRFHPLRGKITEIPSAAIVGSLVADSTCALRVCHCRVDGSVRLDGCPIEEFRPSRKELVAVKGDFSAKGCLALEKVEGEFCSNVTLSGSGIREIGKGFVCRETLGVEGCGNLKSLDCEAKSIIADDSSLEFLGDKLRVKNLSAARCKSLSSVGAVSGLRWACLNGSGIRELTEDFQCGGHVHLLGCDRLGKLSGRMLRADASGAPLTLMSNFSARELFLRDCPSLPTSVRNLDLEVLSIEGCQLRAMPSGVPPKTEIRLSACPEFLRLPRSWFGAIHLFQLQSLEETPPGFRCSGNLIVSECPSLRRIGGEVGGDLNLGGGCPSLKALGGELRVGGDLWLSPDSSVHSLDCVVGGGMLAKESPLAWTGPSFRCGGEANFDSCRNLVQLRGFFAKKVVLDKSSIHALGADFECAGDVLLRNTASLVSLNCSVSGDILVSSSNLKRTGPAFRCLGNLELRGCPEISSLDGVAEGWVFLPPGTQERLGKEGLFRMRGGTTTRRPADGLIGAQLPRDVQGLSAPQTAPPARVKARARQIGG